MDRPRFAGLNLPQRRTRWNRASRGRVHPPQGRRHCHAGRRGRAAKQATSVIPIVFAAAVDPVGDGLNILALGKRLPTIHGNQELVEAGGLMSYGPNFVNLYGHAADFVDKILRGAKPSDIPVEQPTKFDLVVNLITAQALGLTIPESFLLRADEVIE